MDKETNESVRMLSVKRKYEVLLDKLRVLYPESVYTYDVMNHIAKFYIQKGERRYRFRISDPDMIIMTPDEMYGWIYGRMTRLEEM